MGHVVMASAKRDHVFGIVIPTGAVVLDVVGVFPGRASSVLARPGQADNAHSVPLVDDVVQNFPVTNTLGLGGRTEPAWLNAHAVNRAPTGAAETDGRWYARVVRMVKGVVTEITAFMVQDGTKNWEIVARWLQRKVFEFDGQMVAKAKQLPWK